ncbi:YIP1 family protein [Halorhabdus sp. BNX81]|uniref:YIP1 family protein n=1 Tax=Halorhabdus sp. BNX81 TaxID=2980181 RepID=UPI0023DD405C|nr:YIP1 family protein [Halorhabdus sp. BNX81]WEL21692.1 putative membrane protein, Yip1 family [Halorhabdus sp. BNX81]
MTQWVDPAGHGRERGPVGLFRAWIGILTTPRKFFRQAVAPGDQAPGLVFLAVVVAIEESVRYVLVPGAAPVVGNRPVATAVLAVLVTVVLIAPTGLHLLAAIQTVLLWPVAADRAGISETVQVLAYATAPCVVAGVPWPPLQVVAAGYGSLLLILGLSTVHDVSYVEGTLTGVIPVVLLYGVAFGGFDALSAVV